jgi:TRAP-type uncharacterized transport system substrate-binding protein
MQDRVLRIHTARSGPNRAGDALVRLHAMLLPSLSRRAVFVLVALGLAGLAALLWLASRSISPAPPRRIDMTTGAIDGASHQFALKYQALLKRNGVMLNLLPSVGSVQNLERLNAGTPAGFVQGGLGLLTLDAETLQAETPLRSLGVVGYEPVWIFASSRESARALGKGLGTLAGKKVAIGANGSGTRKVALELLQGYGVTPANATLSPDGGLAAANALLARQLDALVIIGAPQAPAVQLLLSQPELFLVSIDHAEGLTRRLPYLSLVTLKAGSVDPKRDQPTNDIALLATTANLVIRDDIHPALAFLLLEAARDVHQGATLLNRPGEFPHPRGTDYPLADEAQRYYKDGRPFLQRYLPYWAANALARLLLVLVPLLAIAIPVVKILPKLWDYKEERRLFKRYGMLLALEREIAARQLSPQEAASVKARLDDIDRDISTAKFSLDFTDRVYTLRQHVDYVRSQLVK